MNAPMRTALCSLILMGLASSGRAGDLAVDDLTVNQNATFYGKVEVVKEVGVVPTSGRVLYYDFNTNATPVADGSGNGNTGTVSGATWTTNGYSGGGYSLDGSDDYILTATANFPTGAVGASYALWLKPNNNSGSDRRVLEYGGNTGVQNFNLYIDANVYAVDYWSGNKSTLVSAQQGVWQHVALVSDGTNHYFYLNGVLEKSGAHALALVNSGNMQIGRYCGGGYNYNGSIDELMVFNRALSEAEVRLLYRYYVPAGEQAGQLLAEGIVSSNAVQQTQNSATNYFMGKVGIGTTNPVEQLTVNGKLQMEDNIKLNGNWLSGDGDDEGVSVDSDGQVGIGTNAPAHTLHVVGDAKITGQALLLQACGQAQGDVSMGVYTNGEPQW